MTGLAVAAAASCTLDECLENASECKGQECLDANTLATSTGDWWCKCTGGASGTALGAPAECEYTYGGCAEAENRQVCEASGQRCVAGTAGDAGDWRCACVAPAKGAPQSRGAAVCGLDECRDACLTCARAGAGEMDPCTLAGQECYDSDVSPAALSTWVCRCTEGVGEAPLAPAACQDGECVEGGAAWDVCRGAGQVCIDDDVAQDTWYCQCASDSTERALLAAVAACGVNECEATPANADVCRAAGQVCKDPDTRLESTGDWTCVCPGAGSVSAVGRAASCAVDECLVAANRAVCEARGETCTDPTAAAGDWNCTGVQLLPRGEDDDGCSFWACWWWLLLLLLCCCCCVILALLLFVRRRHENPDEDDWKNNTDFKATAEDAEGLEMEDEARAEYKEGAGVGRQESSKSLLYGQSEGGASTPSDAV
eukprot:TRINITY_DN803_c0_g1_i2.p1 TRINITY_DN803_c0_g1~~TRINITY_DN803_c0_g1_i2.p1  ORF type:complete len:475 (+),score=205.13 TRINITY_DN803_c0_g1_i2:142-1425(+)